MADIAIALEKIEVSDDGSTWTDLGKTKGGAIFRQTPTEVEIESDQDVDPIAVLTTGLRREIEANLIDCNPSNLAFVFGGTVAGDVVTLPNTASEGVTKQVKLTTKAISGYKFEILIPKGRLKPEGEITINNEGNAVVKLSIVALADTQAPTISKVAI